MRFPRRPANSSGHDRSATDEPSPGAGQAAYDASFLAHQDALVLAPAKKKANQETSEDELDRRREAATAVPAVEAVAGEELAPTGPREAKDVLEVRRRSGKRAANGRVERSPDRGEEQNSGDARADLEAAVWDVLMRHPIASEVEQQPER